MNQVKQLSTNKTNRLMKAVKQLPTNKANRLMKAVKQLPTNKANRLMKAVDISIANTQTKTTADATEKWFLGNNWADCEALDDFEITCGSDSARLLLTPDDPVHPGKIICDDCGAVRQELSPVELISFVSGLSADGLPAVTSIGGGAQ